MNISDQMNARLVAAFEPKTLTITDESEKHIGHSGYQEGGQSHFDIVIETEVFAPMSRIERHRAVHNALGKDLVGRIHALALHISV